LFDAKSTIETCKSDSPKVFINEFFTRMSHTLLLSALLNNHLREKNELNSTVIARAIGVLAVGVILFWVRRRKHDQYPEENVISFG